MKQTQRWIAFLLILAMTFTLLPAAAFAADGADTSAEPAVMEEAAEEPVSAPETEEPAEPEMHENSARVVLRYGSGIQQGSRRGGSGTPAGKRADAGAACGEGAARGL